MAKVIKYGDTTGIESDFKQAPVGLYYAKVESVGPRTSNNDEEMVEVKFLVTKDANGKKVKEKYAPIWYYAPLDTESSWARRLKELVSAFGLKAKGGNLGVIEGKEAMLRLREGTDQDGEYRPNIGKVIAPSKAEPEEDEEEEESNGDLDEMDRSELKALIKREGLEVTVRKSMSDDDLRAAIGELWPADEEEEEEDEEEEDEEDEEEDEEPEDNYDEMSVKELREELENRELETKGAKKVLVARLRTDDQEEPV